MTRNVILVVAVFVIAASFLAYITKIPGETVFELAIGWAVFIERSFRRLTVNWNAVATAAVCIVLLVVGGHGFLRWLAGSLRSGKPADGPAAANSGHKTAIGPVWPLKRTVQLLVVFMLLFIAGTAFIGLVHQMAWLATAPEPLTRYRLAERGYSNSETNLKWWIATGFQGFRDSYKQTAPNGDAPQLKQGSHSWLTRILPFTGMQRPEIDMALDWDDWRNAAAFRRFVRSYLNPDIGVLRTDRGYAVSHYAGNRRFFSRSGPATPDSIEHGATNTIVCGEIASDFAAWGDPANLRDPADGVNQSQHGFGSTNERGANFLMLDGSVRFLASDTDRDLLATLATPE